MERRPLLGDEAVALGAIHAGLSGAYSYPGTPATEIFEFVERETNGGPNAADGGVHCVWSANEKVALEESLGMSFAGRRALVSFKHVGLNVAADPFMNAAITGVNGGLMVAVADDPGMHSSQNEQDSRVFANFALLPCLEPANGQEAYDMTQEAFELSEKFRIPFTMRLVTRLAHSRSAVKCGTRRQPNPLHPSECAMDWTLLPSNARRRYARLAEMQDDLVRWSEDSRWNSLHINPKGDGKLGVIACGVGYNYFMENLPDVAGGALSYLKLGAYPIPTRLVEELLEKVDTVLVLEDGYPHVEATLNGLLGAPRGKRIIGRLTGHLPRTGELNPDLVRAALGIPMRSRQGVPIIKLPTRPPSLCAGCPHIDTYKAVGILMEEFPSMKIFSDIGCYTLAALPPHNACHSCVDMGASISMAMGAAQAGIFPVLATIGDSTFLHSGMTPLVGAAGQNLNMTVMILDNATVAMTGGQPSIASGDSLVTIVKGLGVNPDHIHVVNAHPRHHEANLELFRKEILHPGLSVIIPTRECIQTIKKK